MQIPCVQMRIPCDNTFYLDQKEVGLSYNKIM